MKSSSLEAGFAPPQLEMREYSFLIGGALLLLKMGVTKLLLRKPGAIDEFASAVVNCSSRVQAAFLIVPLAPGRHQSPVLV